MALPCLLLMCALAVACGAPIGDYDKADKFDAPLPMFSDLQSLDNYMDVTNTLKGYWGNPDLFEGLLNDLRNKRGAMKSEDKDLARQSMIDYSSKITAHRIKYAGESKQLKKKTIPTSKPRKSDDYIDGYLRVFRSVPGTSPSDFDEDFSS